jgi:hypothetical protein
MKFAVKDLGPLHYFLGVEVTKVPNGLMLSQQHHIMSLLQKANIYTAKPMTSPMSSAYQLHKLEWDSFDDPSLYCSVVGSLQYLFFTHPDIMFAVNKVCQFI